MSDIFYQNSIYQQLGFNSSNQWLLYDRDFQPFFKWFTQNISAANILSETEALEAESLKQNGEFLNATERQQELQRLEEQWPGLRSCSDTELQQLQQNIELNKQKAEAYADMVQGLSHSNMAVQRHLLALQERQNALLTEEQTCALEVCKWKAKNLEQLQRENSKLNTECGSLFARIQTPALFMHQLPLEEYFLKCDTFLQYFKLYVKENFKILEFVQQHSVYADTPPQAISQQIEILESSLQHYNKQLIQEKSKAHATRALLMHLNVQQIHTLSLADIQRETNDLANLNEYHLKSAQELLQQDLAQQHKHCIAQSIELILQENTKEKYQRACRRYEQVQCIGQMLKAALSNAELIWIAMQLDLQKKSNRFDYAPKLNAEIMATRQRLKYMHQLQLQPVQNQLEQAYLQHWSKLLSEHLQYIVRAELKTCLFEYEKFHFALQNAQTALLQMKRCAPAQLKLQELHQLQLLLHSFVYDDSPNAKPIFESVQFFAQIFKAKTKYRQIEKSLHALRTRFVENFADKMHKDKYFYFSRMLWVYFLTEPKRVLLVIEEVKKAAAKMPSISGFKTLAGIKRM